MQRQPLSALLVDDEPIAREVVATWLEDMGFAVTCASSATEALALLPGQPLDLLVADVNLGDRLDGFELAVAVSERRPGVRVVFMSAKAWGPSQDQDPDTTFLHKPFSAASLAHSVRLVCEGDQRLTSPCLTA